MELVLSGPPVDVLIGRIRITVSLKSSHHRIQLASPEALKPVGLSEQGDKRGADSVVDTDESASPEPASQIAVPEAAERPDLGCIIGTVNTGGNIAAIRAAIGIASKYAGITAAAPLAFAIVVMVAAKDARIGVSGLVSLGIVVVVAAKESGVRMTGFMALGVVVIVSAEQAGIAPADLVAFGIVMGIASEQIGVAVSFVSHDSHSFSFWGDLSLSNSMSNKSD